MRYIQKVLKKTTRIWFQLNGEKWDKREEKSEKNEKDGEKKSGKEVRPLGKKENGLQQRIKELQKGITRTKVDESVRTNITKRENISRLT